MTCDTMAPIGERMPGIGFRADPIVEKVVALLRERRHRGDETPISVDDLRHAGIDTTFSMETYERSER